MGVFQLNPDFSYDIFHEGDKWRIPPEMLEELLQLREQKKVLELLLTAL